MFHFDPLDYLCPSHLQHNITPTFGFNRIIDKTSTSNKSIKVSATSA